MSRRRLIWKSRNVLLEYKLVKVRRTLYDLENVWCDCRLRYVLILVDVLFHGSSGRVWCNRLMLFESGRILCRRRKLYVNVHRMRMTRLCRNTRRLDHVLVLLSRVRLLWKCCCCLWKIRRLDMRVWLRINMMRCKLNVACNRRLRIWKRRNAPRELWIRSCRRTLMLLCRPGRSPLDGCLGMTRMRLIPLVARCDTLKCTVYLLWTRRLLNRDRMSLKVHVRRTNHTLKVNRRKVTLLTTWLEWMLTALTT